MNEMIELVSVIGVRQGRWFRENSQIEETVNAKALRWEPAMSHRETSVTGDADR